MSAAVRCHHLPLHRPLATARGAIATRTVWTLALEHDGRTGLGEAAPLPGFGGEPPERCAEALARAAALLTPALVGDWLERGTVAALDPALESVLAGRPCARCAVEGALADLLAQARALPLAELLAPGAARALPVNALAAGRDQARAAADAGFTTIKCKAPADPAAAARLALALDRELGAGVALRLDANGGWDLDGARRFAGAGARLEYLEQPLPAAALGASARLRRDTGLALALDEAVRTPADIERIGRAGAADAVVLKPMFLGGWGPTSAAIASARRLGLGVVLTSALDGAVGRAQAAHYAAAAGLVERAHGLATGHLLATDLASEPLRPAAGRLVLRDRPGLGVGDLR